jgi:hypothetical protein
MKKAAYRVHRMIQDLTTDPSAAELFRSAPEKIFERYGLTQSERCLLIDGSKDALITLGVHPNLQMKYVKLRVSGKPTGPGPLSYYLARLA